MEEDMDPPTAPSAEPTSRKPSDKEAAGAIKRGRKKLGGLTVAQRVIHAVAGSKARRGISLPALKKILNAGGYDVGKNNSRLKTAIKSLVNKGVLVQLKGTGAAGSFKLNKKQQHEVKAKKIDKRPPPKSKRPAARKEKSPKKRVPAPKNRKSPKNAQARKAPKKPKRSKTLPVPRKAPRAVKSRAKNPKQRRR